MIHTRYSRLVSRDTNVSVTNTFTGDSEFAFDGDIAATVEEQLAVDIDPTQVKSILFYGGGKALTVSTNDAKAGSPTDTILVPAGGVFMWSPDDLSPNPLTAPVTSLYVTNEHATLVAVVKIRILLQVEVP